MAISDPALEFIESQKPPLLDFIFRLTGDRSRAGIVADEVSEAVHRELLSTWSEEDIRVELFSYAFDVNIEVARGIDKSFFEAYYRQQFQDAKKLAVYYPLEIFLLGLGPLPSFILILHYRFSFGAEAIGKILKLTAEEVEREIAEAKKSLKKDSKIKFEDMTELPIYDFLAIPDHHPTDISQILGEMKPRKKEWHPKLMALFGLLGLIVGCIVYLIVLLFSGD